LGDRVEIRNEDFWDSELGEVTVLYYGLVKDEDTPPWFESRLARGARLVTVALPLVGFLPNRADYRFCLKATVISELFSKN